MWLNKRMPGAPLFSSESVKFLRNLKSHNERDWFQPRKHIYDEHVKAPMLALIEIINGELEGTEPSFVTDPAKAMFRIYRDTRFTHDKTPYKTHSSALFWRKSVDRKGGAVLYVSVSPSEAVVAGGSYAPTSSELLAIRQHLSEHHQRFQKILNVKSLKAAFGELRGDMLQRAPKGFETEHKAIELIKRKQWLLRSALDPKIVTTEAFVPEVLRLTRLLIPFVSFLNEPLIKRLSRARDPLLETGF
jgi:uncharacterized protein (TIGR02453 family)